MPIVLVVDDAATERCRAGAMLEKSREPGAVDEPTGIAVRQAANGIEALVAIEREPPDVVVTDLKMPVMDGLELVEKIRGKYPLIPVVIMTAYGNEDVAIEALQRGAASYVSKKNLARDLLNTVSQVLSASRTARDQQRVQHRLQRTESHVVLENDPTLVPPLIAYLRDNLRRLNLCDETGLIRVTMALGEALINAIQHGNLEVSSGLRDDDEHVYHRLLEERRQMKPFCDRRVFVTARETPTEVVYIIRDEGPGFDPAVLPDPTAPVNLERASGRGLLLIRTFMDQVDHNALGNQITMVKRREQVNGH
jgi:CheY-like chemotaxis protein/anti-sigma regulatory factor (Ser/Thr protein kinase)